MGCLKASFESGIQLPPGRGEGGVASHGTHFCDTTVTTSL